MKNFLAAALLAFAIAAMPVSHAFAKKPEEKKPAAVKVVNGTEIPDYEPVKPSKHAGLQPYAGAAEKKAASKDSGLGGLAFAVVILMLYLLPWLIAKNRAHRNSMPIFWLNLLAGWTLVGWFASFIWSLTADTRRAA